MKPFETVESLIAFAESSLIHGPFGFIALIRGTRIFSEFDPFTNAPPTKVKEVRLVV